MSLRTRLAYAAWNAACWGESRRFLRDLDRVGEMQEAYLLRLIRAQESTAFGMRFGFRGMQSVRDYQSGVPITNYEFYRPYLDSLPRQGASPLTHEPIALLEPTSGSTSSTKLIPYTGSLREEFRRGIAPWVRDLLKQYPSIQGGKAYWAITPPAALDFPERKDGIKIGFDDDASYLGVFERALLRGMMAVPAEVAQIRDFASFSYVSLLFLLGESNLRFVSIWSPSYFSELLKKAKTWESALLDDIERGTMRPPAPMDPGLLATLARSHRAQPRRARELRQIFGCSPGETRWPQVWPSLSLISCWTDAWAARSMPELRSLFPDTPVQGKGLLATESFVSLPLESLSNKGCALAYRSHFFEFEEITSGEIHLASELGLGREYAVIVTTGGGLYRYRLGDIVRVEEKVRGCPILKFLGRTNTVDLRGEKLTEAFAQEAVEGALRELGMATSFYFLAPEIHHDPPHYALFVETDFTIPNHAAVKVDKSLQANPHYRLCRGVGQLGGIEIVQIDSRKAYEVRKEKVQRKRAGTAKLSVLESRPNWKHRLVAPSEASLAETKR